MTPMMYAPVAFLQKPKRLVETSSTLLTHYERLDYRFLKRQLSVYTPLFDDRHFAIGRRRVADRLLRQRQRFLGRCQRLVGYFRQSFSFSLLPAMKATRTKVKYVRPNLFALKITPIRGGVKKTTEVLKDGCVIFDVSC